MRRVAILLILLLAGLLLRTLYLNQVAALPFFDQPFGDSAVYMTRAAEIQEGALVPSRPFFFGSVLYPYYLAAVLSIPGGSIYLACLLQVVAGILLAWTLARAARRLFGRPAGFAAAALTVLYGPFAFLEADLIGVAWGLLGVGAAILWLVRWAGRGEAGSRRPGRGRYLLLAGLAIGFAASERPNLALLAPIAAAWVAWVAWRPSGKVSGNSPERGKRDRALGAFGPALVVLIGAAIASCPAILINSVAAGRPTLLQSSTGINLYIGNNPRADGTFDEPWSRELPQFTARSMNLEESSLRMASHLSGRDLTPQEASAFWTARAIEFIRSEPLASLRITIRKAALLWNAAEISNHQTFAFIRRVAPALWLMPVGFGALAPLATLGLILGLLDPRRREGSVLLLAMAAGAAASVLPFFVADRYRAPIVPPLIVAGGLGVIRIARAAIGREARQGRRLAAAIVAAIVLGAIAQLPLTRPDLARGHALLAQAWRARGNLASARSEYEAALAEAGEDGLLLNNLAQVQRAMGLRAEAEWTLRRAIRAEPELAYPHKNLAFILLEKGEADGMLREMEEAARLDPEDAEPFGAMAEIRASRGEREAAAAAYTKARRLVPNDPRLARLLEKYPFLGSEEVTSPRSRP